MLTQAKADELLATPKVMVDRSTIQFPAAGAALQLALRSEDRHEEFSIDVNRRGKIKLSKCTYQERYAVVEILLRLDIDGPPHTNPDGTTMPCPHLHTYREGYGDKWAAPLPADFKNPTDLVETLRDFLKYCNVKEISSIQRSIN